MRKGYEAFIISAEDQLLGINLGADYCSEHEWGIDKIRNAFGILPSIVDETKFGANAQNNPDKKKVFGLPRRQITLVPSSEDFQWFTYTPTWRDGKFEGFIFVKYGLKHLLNNDSFMREYLVGSPSEKSRLTSLEEKERPKTGLYTAWSSGDFMAVSNEPEQIEQLRTLYDAFEKKDIAIWIGGGGAFQNAGLVIAMISRMPSEYISEWAEKDREVYQTRKAAHKTGIEERLRKAGKEFFALSPKRNEDGEIIFWLNPMEQRQNNFGWFTVKDLDDWIEGKGPIPK